MIAILCFLSVTFYKFEGLSLSCISCLTDFSLKQPRSPVSSGLGSAALFAWPASSLARAVRLGTRLLSCFARPTKVFTSSLSSL